MKTKLLLSFFLFTSFANAQGVWNQKANFGGSARNQAVGFSIGTKGYIGTASGNTPDDFWEWDQATNVWTQKANFGGTARLWAVSFSIGTKGYVGTGLDASGNKKDFWEWDQSTNIWTQKANFGGQARREAIGFSIGTNGYIGTGWNASSYNDFWEWDQGTNTWTQKANFVGTARADAVGFSIGSKGYVGTGYDVASRQDFWEYDPSLNSWTQQSDLVGSARANAVGFSIGTKGYIGTGYFLFQDFWEWDPNCALSISSSADTIYCGQNISLNAVYSPFSSNLIYSWSPAAGLNNTTISNPIATSVTSTTTYQVTVQDTITQCTGTAQFKLTVDVIGCTISSSPSTITCGENATLNTTIIPSSSNLTYSWSPATGLSNTSIANPVADPLISTTYTVVVQDTVTQCMRQTPFTLTVSSCTITGTANHNITCGTSDTLTVSFGPNNNVIYSWSPTTGLSNPNISNPIASPTNTTYYQVFVTDTVTQCVGSAQYNLYVNPLFVWVSGSYIQCSVGQSETLCASGGGAYFWSTGQTTSCIIVSPTVTTTYTVGVTNSNGCNASATTSVVIGSPTPGGLTQTYNDSACGLNFVNAYQLTEIRTAQQVPPYSINGTGLPTTLAISGLPNGCSILQAYLWYTVSYQTFSPPSTIVNFTNTIPVTANVASTIIGTGTDKCWAETGTANYRADVTAEISGNGIYGINITGFSNPNWEVDGVDLFIIYQDNSATYQGSLVIWDGNLTTNTGNGFCKTMTGVNACATDTNATAFMLISDMQASTTTSGVHPSTLNGVTAFYPNDFWNWDQAKTTVTSGQDTAYFATDGQNKDCYDWAVMGLYYQTTTCVNCSTTAVLFTPINETISISPNPTTGIFTVTLSGVEGQSSAKISAIEIVNVLGVKVYATPLHLSPKGESVVSLPLGLGQGIYFLHLKTPDGVAVKKIIKQ